MAEASAAARLRLIRTPGVGPVTYRQLVARFGSVEAAIEMLPALVRRGGGEAPRLPDEHDRPRDGGGRAARRPLLVCRRQ